MQLRNYCFVLVAILSTMACSEREDSANVNTLTLKHIKTISVISEDLRIGRLESPMLIYEQDEDKYLFFYDSGLNQVLKVDTSGNINNIFGSVGSGPTQFRHISSFGIDNDTLVVLDASLDKTKKFLLQGGDLTESYDGLIKDKIWIRSNRLYEINGLYYFGVQEASMSTSSNHWKSKTIAVYDRDGNLVDLFGDFDPDLLNSHQLYNYANITAGEDGFIYTTHRTSPTIQKYDVNTRELVSRFGGIYGSFKVSDERPNITDPREVKNKINTQYSFVGDSFVSDEYFAFYFFNFTEEFFAMRNPNDMESFFHIYDKDTDELIGEVELPYYPMGMDSRSNIYLLENDDPDNIQIGVYKLKGI